MPGSAAGKAKESAHVVVVLPAPGGPVDLDGGRKAEDAIHEDIEILVGLGAIMVIEPFVEA